MSRPLWPTRSAPRPPCRSRPSAGCARRLRTRSTAGRPGTSPTWPSSTCPWTAPPSVCTKAPRAEPVLAALGITTEGRPVLVGLATGASESTDAWKRFLDAMVARGLRAPLLIISDDAPGLFGATGLVFPHSLRQRCAIHRPATCVCNCGSPARLNQCSNAATVTPPTSTWATPAAPAGCRPPPPRNGPERHATPPHELPGSCLGPHHRPTPTARSPISAPRTSDRTQ